MFVIVCVCTRMCMCYLCVCIICVCVLEYSNVPIRHYDRCAYVCVHASCLQVAADLTPMNANRGARGQVL